MGEQRDVVQEFYERFGDGDLDAAVAVFSPGVQINDPGLGVVEGLEALRNYLEGLKGPVPDARAIVERVFEVGWSSPGSVDTGGQLLLSLFDCFTVIISSS